jgi:hypothetical protein
MKTYGAVEIQLHAFLTSVLPKGQVSFTPWPLISNITTASKVGWSQEAVYMLLI